MNFLAHIYLSGDDHSIMFGNFIGDFLRGKEVEQFDEKVTLGIRLHRAIDTYTDRHPMVSRSKDRLWDKYRHYAAVIVDIFYDHFLAKNWMRYSKLPLSDFAQQTYDALRAFEPIFPEKVKAIFPNMIQQNWLLRYGDLDGVHQAMQGIAHRARFQSNMEKATADLMEHYQGFDEDFRAFFPEIVQHTEQFLQEHR